MRLNIGPAAAGPAGPAATALKKRFAQKVYRQTDRRTDGRTTDAARLHKLIPLWNELNTGSLHAHVHIGLGCAMNTQEPTGC